jgi:hypothetical protein
MESQQQTPKRRVAVLGNGTLGSERQVRIFQAASRWAEAEKTGTMVSGTFMRAIVDERFGQTNYEIKADAAGEYIDGDGTLQTFDAGSLVIINGNSGLARKMANIPTGTGLEINYLGQAELAKGKYKGKLVHNFEVLVDEGTELIPDESIA